MQSYGAQTPTDKSTAQLLHRCSGIIAEEGTDWIVRARGRDVCCEIISPGKVSDVTPIKHRQPDCLHTI